MTPTVNGLSPDFLSTPTQLDLLTVAATMVWADKHRKRDAFLAHERTKFYGCNVTIPSDLVQDVVSWMLNDTPVSEIATPGYHAGMQAGVYLHHTVAATSRGESLSMKALAASLASWVGPIAAKTPKEFENRVWPAYRPVAHLWAAHVHMHRGLLAKVMPCELTVLPQFLRTRGRLSAACRADADPRTWSKRKVSDLADAWTKRRIRAFTADS